MGCYNDSTARSVDSLLKILKHPYRRDTIKLLSERPGDVIHIDHVVDHLAEVNEVAAGQDRERLAIQIYHNHLPKLAQHDFLEFDPRSGACRYHADEALERLLDSIHRLEFE